MGACQSDQLTNPSRRNLKRRQDSNVVVVGDSGVGKTSVIQQVCDQRFVEAKRASVGTHTRSTTIKLLNGDSVKLQLWDSAGQYRFENLLPMQYRQARVVVVIYDITNQSSFSNCSNWITTAKSQCSDNCIFVLAGNKSDLRSEQQVTQLDGKRLAGDYDMKFAEVSALSGSGVQEIFKSIAEQIVSEDNKKN